ncbi:MAG: DUF58 domain-containing protein [Pirellulaceae bacterium]
MSWLVAAILILLGAMVFQLGLVAFAMYVLLGAVLIGRWMTHFWAKSVVGQRHVSRLMAEVGDRVAININLENRGRLPIAWVLMEDQLSKRALGVRPPALGVSGQRICLCWLPPKGKKLIAFRLECHRRGYYQIGPLTLETGDLFGLHRRYRVVSDPQFLLVYPRVIPLVGYDVSSKRPIGEMKMTHRLFEDPTRTIGVRPYQAGDPLNRINWRATARTGELHSRVYEPTSVAGATLVLDFHEHAFPEKDEPVRSELAITAAASLAHAVYETGQQIGLVTNGRDAADRIRVEGWKAEWHHRQQIKQSTEMLDRNDRLAPVIVPTQRGPAQFNQILESLARLEKTDGFRLAELLIETTSRIPRDSSVVAILSHLDERDAIAMGNMVRQGYAVTAVLNSYEPLDRAESAGMLIAQGVEVLLLRDEDSISELCQHCVLKV